MAKEDPHEEAKLTICLPEGLAQRLKLAAARQNRAPADVAAELLDRHLPRLEVPETKKKNIPYT